MKVPADVKRGKKHFDARHFNATIVEAVFLQEWQMNLL
jgi:hypothetical protein